MPDAPPSLPRTLSAPPMLQGLRAAGLAVIVVCTLLRATTALDPFPYWSMDPMRFTQPIVGLAPMQSLIVDVLTMLGAAMVLLGEARKAGGLLLVPTILALLGSIGIALHAFVLGPNGGNVGGGWDLENTRVGATWIAAVFAGLAILHTAREPRLARLITAIAFASLILIAARGLVQVYIEHPATLEQYRLNREAFIVSQGWSPDSASVRAYERRLNQPEATAWFGMSNVLASFMAAGLSAFLGWTILAARAKQQRKLPDGWLALLVLATVASTAVLYLTRSKGGYAAAALGLGLLALLTLAPRIRALKGLASKPRTTGILPLTLIASALAAVLARGLIGERIGELSILFRSFYLRAAARVFADHPLAGVGPAGFKDAYQLAKPAISPEEVASPHSILFDFAACLGLFGLAWCALWLWQVYRAGRSLAAIPTAAAEAPPTDREARVDAWLCFLIPAAVVFFGSLAEQPSITPDNALLRLLGLLAWMGIAIAALALMRTTPAWRIPAAIAAIVLAVHAQIEITPVWPASAGLFMLMIAAAAGASFSPITPRPRPHLGRALGILILLTAAVWAWVGLLPIARWQAALAESAHALAPIANIRTRLSYLDQPGATETPADIAADLARLAGTSPPQSPEEFDRALAMLAADRAEAAAQALHSAVAIAPAHTPTVEALARLYITIASAEASLGRTGAAAATNAERTARGLVARDATASNLSLLASILTARSELDPDPTHLLDAAQALIAADRLDPHGLSFPVRLVRTYTSLGDTNQARHWAAIARERDQLQRLDPLRRLTDQEQRLIEGAAANP